MFLRSLSAWLFSACSSCAVVCAQDGIFEVWKGDDRVGHITVGRTIAGNRTSYWMTSISSFEIIWKQNVRSITATEYVNDQVTACYSSMHVNDAVRDSSRMLTVGDRALCFVHPTSYFEGNATNPWTTARMYYEEPTGQPSIFVESALHDCPLQRMAEGEYQLTLPNKKRNYYIYRKGVLHEIRIERTWFDLVFKRV
ncbi:MAG: hypothetical protein IPP33_15715 [Flavobacteriales bacterium]|nr:hypothetical protein [Flavobacteriales bacterium]